MTGTGSVLAACGFAGPVAILAFVGKESGPAHIRCERSTVASSRIVRRCPATYTVYRRLFGKVVLVDAGQPHVETVA
jgi:hypothetical protein